MTRPEIKPFKRMDDEPVFDEPWQAQVLAMVDSLITSGVKRSFDLVDIDRSESLFATQIMHAVHNTQSFASGDNTRSVPIIELRVTSLASASSLNSFVASGRCGNTR